jgi:uncharacterized membrane protein
MHGQTATIAVSPATVVVADFLFTASAVIAQPVTGGLLAREAGYSLWEGWIVRLIVLYVVTGLFWCRSSGCRWKCGVWPNRQHKTGMPLPERYPTVFRLWFAFGFPAFAAVVAIFRLMIARSSDRRMTTLAAEGAETGTDRARPRCTS